MKTTNIQSESNITTQTLKKNTIEAQITQKQNSVMVRVLPLFWPRSEGRGYIPPLPHRWGSRRIGAIMEKDTIE